MTSQASYSEVAFLKDGIEFLAVLLTMNDNIFFKMLLLDNT